MDYVLAFLALKAVELGFVLGVLSIVGILGGVVFGVFALINLIMNKITKGNFDLEDVLPYVIGFFIGAILLVWLIGNCIATPVVVEKWKQNPEVSKIKIAFQHAFEEEPKENKDSK